MFLIRLNDFTGKYYKYDTDDYDMFTPMFDDGLHVDTGEEIVCSYKSKVCAYCQTEFPSRNKLFYHLGYHNIDIRTKRCNMECDAEMEPDQDEVINRKRRVRRRRRVWYHSKRHGVHKIQNHKHVDMEKLTNMLRLIDIKKS